MLRRPPCTVHLVPGRMAPERTQERYEAWETMLQGMVFDATTPLAFEITGEGQTKTKRFLLRASSPQTLDHALSQLQVRVPQVQARPLLPQEDPLTLERGERSSVCELRAGADAYLPLRTMKEADPLRGVLAAVSTLPPDLRAVAQIALIPLPASWSQGYLRKALEHPLEQERQARREALLTSRAPSGNTLLLLCLLLVGLVLWTVFGDPAALTTWVRALHAGQMPRLHTLAQEQLPLWGGAGGLVVLVLLLLLQLLRRKHLYLASRQVEQRLLQCAYRGRIYLYVIGPGTRMALLPRWWALTRWLWQGLRQQHSWRTSAQHITHLWRLTWLEWQWRARQRQRRHDALTHLAATYRQFDSSAGHFVPRTLPERRAQALAQGRWEQSVPRSRHYLTGDFVARAWNLAQAAQLTDVPGLEQKRSRSLLVPQALVAPLGAPIVGVSEHAGQSLPFAFPPDFFRSHVLIAGKSGEGKSTLMLHLARAAAQHDQALFVLDPHGDLALDLLRFLPASRSADVVLLDLGDPDVCVGINPLDASAGQEREVIISTLITTFARIWENGWGPRMEASFRMALATLYEANLSLLEQDRAREQYTLLDVFAVLMDERFCHAVLALVRDPFVHRFWYQYFDPLDGRQQRERIDPVLTKMVPFEARTARAIVGQSCSTVSFKTLLRERRIVIIRLAAGEIGSVTASLLGATLLGLMLSAHQQQSVLPEAERVRSTLIIDEFQSMAGADYALLLAELRKYGAAAVLATQSCEYLTTVSPTLLPTALANCQHLVTFRLSAADAWTLHREMQVEQEDLVLLNRYTCYLRLTHQSLVYPTFSLRLHQPALGPEGCIDWFRARSAAFTRSRTELEQELQHHLAATLRAQPPQQEALAQPAATGEPAATPSAPPVPVPSPKKQGRSRSTRFAKKRERSVQQQLSTFDEQDNEEIESAEDAETTGAEQ